MRKSMAATLALALAGALVAAEAAWPCSCALDRDWSIERTLARGHALAEVTPTSRRLDPATGLRLYRVTVHRALGPIPRGSIEIATPTAAASCGVTLRPDTRQWVSLAHQLEGWGAWLCDQYPLRTVDPAQWDRLAPPTD